MPFHCFKYKKNKYQFHCIRNDATVLYLYIHVPCVHWRDVAARIFIGCINRKRTSRLFVKTFGLIIIWLKFCERKHLNWRCSRDIAKFHNVPRSTYVAGFWHTEENENEIVAGQLRPVHQYSESVIRSECSQSFSLFELVSRNFCQGSWIWALVIFICSIMIERVVVASP